MQPGDTVLVQNHTKGPFDPKYVGDYGIVALRGNQVEVRPSIGGYNFPTHRHGNTLDIIATEIASSLNITTCQPCPFLSDHCNIGCTTNIIREDIGKTVSFRKIKDINTQKFQDDVVNQLMMDNECRNIDVLVQNLETTLHDTLEVHAPLITKSVTFRHKCLWFSGTIKQQKE